MTFSFDKNQAYLLSKNVYRLVLLYTQKEDFKKHDTLRKRMEKSSLCIVSLIIKSSIPELAGEKTKALPQLLHLTSNLYSLYDIALDLKLIDKKDLILIESALKELDQEIKKL